jgi:chromosome segregation ATPase
MTGQARDDLEEYVSEETEVKSPQHDAREKKDSLGESQTTTETPRKGTDGMSLFSTIFSSLHPEEAQASTPRTVEHVPTSTKKVFQASVEDHDDTPSRVQSSSAIGATLRSPEFTLKSRPSFLQRDGNPEDHDAETETAKSLREVLSQLRQELNDVRTMSQQELYRVREEYEREAKRVRVQYEETKRQEAARESQMQAQEQEWQRRLSAAKREHEQELELARATTTQADQTHILQQQLAGMRTELATKDTRIAELKQVVATQENELRVIEAREACLKEERDAAIENHRTMLIAHNNAQHVQSQQIEELQTQHTALVASKTELKSKIHSLEADISDLHIQHANEIEEIASKINDAAEETQDVRMREQQASQATIAELEQENQRLHSQLDEKDDEIDALGGELQQLRLSTAAAVEEKNKAVTKLKEQKTLNDQAAREIQSLRSGTKILQARLSDAEERDVVSLETLEAQLAEANAARLESDAEVDEMKEQLRAVQSSLTASQAEVLVAREELTRFKQDSELINKAMDKRMRELMRAREAQWAKRLDALRQEAGFRGEVLMREWGRAELGVSEPQGYRYQFV